MVEKIEDNYRHKGMRRRLMDNIKEKGITDQKVLDAMMNVPRHVFLSSAFLEYAYDDKPFQIGAGQTISQPFTVGFQTQLLDISPREKVLEIGTGSGYQAAVLCELGAKVYTIERQKVLFDKAKKMLARLNYTAKVFFGDGYKGKPQFGPYDKILVTCGAPRIPEKLLEQLKVGGKMVIPLGSGKVQEMTEIIKVDENEYKRKKHGSFSFVPMLEKKQMTDPDKQ
jgi:protein-L-isoaspartate(D-aspartate) O-methyltransferase